MDICKKELDRASKDSRIHKNEVRIRVLGRLDLLPEDIAKSAEYVMNQTKKYDKYSFNIIEDIKEPIVSKYLYTNGIPDPDIILRTSGEERISNFLLWQLAYSELYFSDVYWPAFQKRDFLKAIRTVQQRKRRFGK